MSSLRRWKNPFTPHGRKSRKKGLAITRGKVEGQLEGMAYALWSDIAGVAKEYGIKTFGFGWHDITVETNASWKKRLLDFYAKEELVQIPMAELGLDASLVILVSCDYLADDICAILMATPDSQFFESLRDKYWSDDPNANTKLQMAVDKIHKEIADKIKQFGFVMGEPLLYDIRTKDGIPLTVIPLYSKTGFDIF